MVWLAWWRARRMLCARCVTTLILFGLLPPGSVLAAGGSFIVIDRAHDDRVALSAALRSAPDLPPGADVVVAVGPIELRAPAAAVRRRGTVLSYVGPKGGVGLARLRIDLRRSRLLLRAQHVVLPTNAGPTLFRVGTDAGLTGVVMMRAVPPRARRKRGAQRFRLVPDVPFTLLADPVRPSPATVVVGVPTTVHFRAGLRTDPFTTHFSIVRLDARGEPKGPVLCTFESGQDGCDATVTETAPGEIGVVVQADVQRAAVISPTATLLVVPPVTALDGATLVSVEQQADAIFATAVARLGDSLDARMAALAEIRRLAGVQDATLSPDGDNLVFRFTSGLLGGLVLGVRSDGTSSAGLARASRRATPVATPSVAVDPCTPTRQVTDNLRVTIFDPGFFPRSEATAIASQLQASCVSYQVNALLDDAATISALTSASGSSTLVMVTHGIVDWYGRVGFGTADDFLTLFESDMAIFQTDVLIAAKLPGGPVAVFVTPDYPGLPSVAGGIVYAGFCYSDFNDTLARRFEPSAKAYFGFDRSVDSDFAAGSGTQLFNGLVSRFQTTGDAYEAVDPKIEPRISSTARAAAAAGPQPSAVGIVKKPATFVKDGADDLAYVGFANLTPASPTVNPGTDHATATLTATVERAENCALRFHWHAGATYGHLSNADGQDDFDSDSNTAQYQANAGAQQGIENVQVEVRPPADANAGDTVVATACGTVNVSQQPHTLHIVFDGQGTWSQTLPANPPTPDFHATAMVTWHAVYALSLPTFEPFGTQEAGAGTTVTGTSAISGPSNCSGGLIVNTSHGQGPPPPNAQTPFLLPLPAPSPTKRYAIDAMGGYDYRLCDGEYNIGEGNWASGDPFLPGYAGAPFFGIFSFDRDDFVDAPHMQTIPLSVGATATVGAADVTWDGTVTLSSE